MSLAGIDFGNTKGVVALARRRGIDVVNNEQSKRESDSYFSFNGKQRLYGYTAKAQEVQNYENTLTGMKSFLGLNYEDPQFQEILPKMGWKNFVALKNGEVGYSFDYGINKEGEKEKITLSSTQIGTQMFNYLKEVGHKNQSGNDCVLSYPAYYSDRRKHALRASAEVSGLRVLSMISESKAISLAWGFPKKDLPEKAEDASVVCFVDFGHSHITATVSSFTKKKIQILSEAHSTRVGGREIDWLYSSYLTNLIEEKFQIKISEIQRKKSLCRFFNAVTKTKVMLSSAPNVVPFSVDCLHNDRDIFLTLQRDVYELLITPMIDQAIEVVKRAIKLSNKDLSEISFMEIVGGSSRIPLFKSKLQEYYGKPLSMTLNATECVASGCAFQAAILSPLFQTKSITFKDSNIYPIFLCWKDLALPKSSKEEKEQEQEQEQENVEIELKSQEVTDISNYEPIEMNKSNSIILIKRNNILPTLKEIKFTKSGPFRIQAQYHNSELLSEKQPEFLDIPPSNQIIGVYDIKDFPVNTEKPTLIKVRFEIDNFGIFKLRSNENNTNNNKNQENENEKKILMGNEQKENINQKENEEKIAPENENEQEVETEKKQNNENETQKIEEEEKKQKQPEEKQNQPEEPQYKTKIKKVEKLYKLKTNIIDFSIPSSVMQELKSIEYEIKVQNKIILEKLNMKNSLESYIYDLRNSLLTNWKPFASEETIKEIMVDLDKMEDWIYGDGFDVSKEEYEKHLNILKEKGNPIQYRFEESPKRINIFEIIDTQIKFCLENLKKDEFNHLDEEEIIKIENNCKKMKEWTAKKQEQQKKKELYEDVAISSEELHNKFKHFFHSCQVIFNKPRPIPKPKPQPMPKIKTDLEQNKVNEDQINQKKIHQDNNENDLNKGDKINIEKKIEIENENEVKDHNDDLNSNDLEF
ncbi:hsc70cb isoform g-related [Anaeramoeba flamelloides]|uniref:Hsc70cb isoform g-related n=1 Tax=Anaeramoeba flamelloides TaxID=1746091 RepID=A0AAV7YAL2_9EUKA|nr:hsc70cb isoform g-related [Anaeramoeba flamelloides]